MRWLPAACACLLLASCDYEEVEREIGYKGKARVNPWLAAERFVSAYEDDVRSLVSWTAPEPDDALWFVPAPVLGNVSFTRKVEEWVDGGGHLVLLVEHADAERNDWSSHSEPPRLEPPLLEMLDRSGLKLIENSRAEGETTGTSVRLEDRKYKVDARSKVRVESDDGQKGVFASVRSGEGRISVLTDARIFRNRWIEEKEHAALLDGLVRVTDYEGSIAFIRGSGLSLWGMLARHLWPVLVALAVLTLLWLWKNFSRFGPLEAASEPSPLRGYDHHLEALGDFQWRLDRAAGLLAPLRNELIERGQRVAVRSGRRDEDFFQFLAERSGLSRERVHRALAEPSPPDSAVLTRTTADLQRLLDVLH